MFSLSQLYYFVLTVHLQSFGEIRTMSRKPNGDIHIDFRKSNVADTVCRVRGHVTMDGASVHLSWFSGKKVTKIYNIASPSKQVFLASLHDSYLRIKRIPKALTPG
jgi:hypothetical protein